MRIAYLVSQYPATSHTFIRREIAALRRKKLGISVFSIRRPKPEELMSEADRMDEAETTYILPARPFQLLISVARQLVRRPSKFFSALRLAVRHRNPGLKALIYSFYYFVEGMLLAECIEKQRAMHLHNHFANPASHVAMVASHLLDIPLSMTLHGLCDFDYPAGPLLDSKIEACTFVACATQYGVAQAMRQSNPDRWHKLKVVRCGVDMDNLPVRSYDGPTSKRMRIICVGRFSPEKGQLGLLDAFALAQHLGLDADLILVGDGPDRERIETCIQELGLSNRVELRGRLSETCTLKEIARADLLVLASFMEGLPVVLMEALALEVPVIAPAVAGIPELVVHRETGLLFNAGDWIELAERILEVSREPALRRRMGAAGRRRVEETFDIATAVQPLVAHFRAPDWKSDSQGFELARSMIHCLEREVDHGSLLFTRSSGAGRHLCRGGPFLPGGRRAF